MVSAPYTSNGGNVYIEMTPLSIGVKNMGEVDNKPKKIGSPFKRALDYARSLGKIDGIDLQDLFKWLEITQRHVGEAINKVFPSAFSLCFLGVADIVSAVNYCPREGLISLILGEAGYYLKWIEGKRNTLRFCDDLSEEEKALGDFLLFTLHDLTTNIIYLRYMDKKEAKKFLKQMAEWKRWIEANYGSDTESGNRLDQFMKKIFEYQEPAEAFEACLKEEERNFSPESGPSIEEEIRKTIALASLIGDTEAELRGRIAEIKYAEKYPKIILYRLMGGRVIVGIPDGLASEFIYEHKSPKDKGNAKYALERARLQTDIYSFLFYRPKKRIQISIDDSSIPDSERFLVVEEDTNPERGRKAILKVLDMINQFEHGIIPPEPPNKNRCKSCEYKGRCYSFLSEAMERRLNNSSRSQETLSF